MGRQRELGLVVSAARQAPAAGLVTVVINGEAGIGKSTLLDHAGAALGWRALPVRADGLLRRVPYAAIVEALGNLRVADSYSVGLLRELRAAFELPDAPARACAAMTRLLTALTATGPVAVLVDDADQLDEDSQVLLAVSLRRLASAPLAVLAALRAGSAPLIEHLAGASELTAVALGPMETAELAQIAGVPVGSALLAKADGNPFFATELARIGGASGPEALLRRIAPLTAGTRAVAHALAVLRRVRLDRLELLARVAGLDSVTGAFDELVRYNLITLGGDGTYRFTHDIVAEACYAETGPARRRELHARVAAELLAERDRGLPTDLLELAWHVAESARPGDWAAITVLTEAARQARPRAPERAVALCVRALELLPEGAAERAVLESIRCRALARASRPNEAIGAGFAALAGLSAGSDREHTVTALVGSLFSAGRLEEAIEVVSAEAASPSLRASRALLLSFAGREAEARAEAERAEKSIVDISVDQRVQVLCQLTMVSSMLNEHEHTAGYADGALAAAGSAPTLRAQALAVGATTSALAGLVTDARDRLAKAEEPRDAGLFHGELLVSRIALDWLAGRWEPALRALGTAGDLPAMLAHAAHAIELDIRAWRGELELAARLAERPAPRPRNMAGLHAVALADYLIARGDPGAAERMITRLDPATPYGCLLLGRLVELRLAAGRHDDAVSALKTLTAVATGRFAPWSRVTLLRATGLVHGDLDALRSAVAEAADLGFERARAVLALGLRCADVTEELVGAYRSFAAMGAHGLRREAGRRLRELGAKVPRARSRTAGLLTEAEERIAALVRQGMRNREIAAALNYSPRSVEVYLSRIYAKLGVTSRLALARTLDTAGRLG